MRYQLVILAAVMAALVSSMASIALTAPEAKKRPSANSDPLAHQAPHYELTEGKGKISATVKVDTEKFGTKLRGQNLTWSNPRAFVELAIYDEATKRWAFMSEKVVPKKDIIFVFEDAKIAKPTMPGSKKLFYSHVHLTCDGTASIDGGNVSVSASAFIRYRFFLDTNGEVSTFTEKKGDIKIPGQQIPVITHECSGLNSSNGYTCCVNVDPSSSLVTARVECPGEFPFMGAALPPMPNPTGQYCFGFGVSGPEPNARICTMCVNAMNPATGEQNTVCKPVEID